MPIGGWNLWKVTAIGMAVVFAVALVTGLVVANWVGNQKGKPVTSAVQKAVLPHVAMRPVPPRPSASDVEACKRYASAAVDDKTTEVVKDVLIGGAIGAGVGAAGGAIGGGGKGAGKGAGIGGLVGATAGTLYGLNEAHQYEARYAAAYQICAHKRGFIQ